MSGYCEWCDESYKSWNAHRESQQHEDSVFIMTQHIPTGSYCTNPEDYNGDKECRHYYEDQDGRQCAIGHINLTGYWPIRPLVCINNRRQQDCANGDR